MKLKVLVVAGDGIGPEVTGEAVRVLRSVAEMGGHNFEFREELIGGVAIKKEGSPLPPSTLDAALDSDAVLLGAVGGNEFNSLPPNKRPEAGLLQLRQALGGYANLRPSFAWRTWHSSWLRRGGRKSHQWIRRTCWRFRNCGARR